MSDSRSRIAQSFEDFRERLAHQDALPQLVVLGLIAGIASSLIIVAFRWLIETPLLTFFGDNSDSFESLSPLLRFSVPFGGAVLLGLALSRVKVEHRSVSVTHVLERLHNNNAKLPGRNIFLQFFGGIVALASGQSVGREGPSVHLGAAVSSQLGQFFGLPHNSLRTLVACGAAAAIAASFNTPMAGVVFAMEVILMEYTIAGFIPVIVASVLGATISQLVLTSDISLGNSSEVVDVLSQLPYLVFAGVLFAIAAALYIKLHLAFFGLHRYSILLRFSAIGLVTGAVAVFIPEILGTGYDTLGVAMGGELLLETLLIIAVAKLLVTAMATGLGMLGGLIGPTLVIGGCLGGVVGLIGAWFVPEASYPDMYVLLGMVAMMGAVLNAPLAALVAILELSSNPSIIFPSMLTVVVSCVIVREVFNYEGVFVEQLKRHGHNINEGVGKGFLARIGVGSVMNRSFARCESQLSVTEARQLVSEKPLWLIFEPGDVLALLATSDLVRELEQCGEDESEIDLTSFGNRILQTTEISALSSLREAGELIQQTGADALLIVSPDSRENASVKGVVTRQTMLAYYGM